MAKGKVIKLRPDHGIEPVDEVLAFYGGPATSDDEEAGLAALYDLADRGILTGERAFAVLDAVRRDRARTMSDEARAMAAFRFARSRRARERGPAAQ